MLPSPTARGSPRGPWREAAGTTAHKPALAVAPQPHHTHSRKQPCAPQHADISPQPQLQQQYHQQQQPEPSLLSIATVVQHPNTELHLQSQAVCVEGPQPIAEATINHHPNLPPIKTSVKPDKRSRGHKQPRGMISTPTVNGTPVWSKVTTFRSKLTTRRWWVQHWEAALGVTVGVLLVLIFLSCTLQYGVLGSRHFHIDVPLITFNPIPPAAAAGGNGASGSGNSSTAQSASYEAQFRAYAGVVGLMTFYVPAEGYFHRAGWWNNANSAQTLLEYISISGSQDYFGIVENNFDLNSGANFLTNYYDDQGWWAVAWARAYMLQPKQKYLNTAIALFNDLKYGWDTSNCNGGMLWKKKYPYKSSISLLLYADIALLLASITGDKSYNDYAFNAMKWLNDTQLLTTDGKVIDGIKGEDCSIENGVLSYNQGVILGVLFEMYQVTGDISYIKAAERSADVGIGPELSPGGVLHEGCEPQCNYDFQQFKGIFVRYLYRFYSALTKLANSGVYVSPRTNAYREFMLKQADAVWNRARNASSGIMSPNWRDGPPPKDEGNAVAQTAAVDALTAAMGIELYG